MKKFSVLEKYNIVSEGRSKNERVAKVCEKYGICRENFYQWEAPINEAALEALEDKASRKSNWQPTIIINYN